MSRNRRRRADAQPSRAAVGMGLLGGMTAHAQDVFQNLLARTGAFSGSLENGTEYPLTRFTLNFWGLVSMYESSWIARRIVDAPAADIVKTWPKIACDMDPKHLAKVGAAVVRTNTKGAFLEGLHWGRLFGGAGALMVIKGHEDRLDEPLDLDSVPLGGFKGLSIFDRWSGIQPSGAVCEDIERPLDVNLPEYYDVSATGGRSFKVHASRVLRFCGPKMPEPENSVYSGWGISVLAPVLQSMIATDNLYANALSLSFRANLIGMKEETLAQALSGVGMNQKAAEAFAQRMQAINRTMSNQSLIITGKDGGLENIQYSFGGLAELIQMFQLQLAGAAKMPVSLLWGRLYNGLGNSGEGDERIYEKTIATEAEVSMRPQMEKLLPVVCMSELGEVPDDMELNFPSIRVLDEKEKADLARATVDTLTVAINVGCLSKRAYAQELQQLGSTTDMFTNVTDEFVASLPDTAEPEGELGAGLFGEEEGEPRLKPSGSPQTVLREEGREREQQERAEHAADRVEVGDDVPLPWIGFDLDGTLAQYDGYKGATHIGEPIKNGVAWPELMAALRRGDKVKIFTARVADDPEGVARRAIEVWCRRHIGCVLPVTCVKDAGMTRLYDDRAVACDADGPQVGPVRMVHGLKVVIETPKGYSRHGKGWSVALPYDYGYFQGIEGADGDSLDVALGDDPTSNWAYIFDQRSLEDPKKFDESKCFLNWPSMEAAGLAFRVGHHRWRDVYMDVTPMPISEFKQWLKDGDHRRPCREW